MDSAKSSVSYYEKVSLHTEELSKLVCPVCFEYMKPPIMQCENAHGICELCHELLSECPLCHRKLTYRRSSHLETLSTLVLFPCKQCFKQFSLDDLDTHKCIKEAEEPDALCIIGQVYGECCWRGQAKDMTEHCSTQHPNNYWKSKVNATRWKYCDLANVGIQNIFLLDLTESVFIIVQKFDSSTQSLQWNASCETEKGSEQYVYEVQLYSETHLDTLICRNVIENEQNIMKSLPSGNEIVIPLAKVNEFLNGNCVHYKVIIHKKSDIQKDNSVNYYQVFSEVTDGNTGPREEITKNTCSQKTWNSVVYIYNLVKSRLGC